MYCFFNETATTENYTDGHTLSLHDALPIFRAARGEGTLRRSIHSRKGTSAMAITSAAVSGRKNSAPSLKAKGSARISPTPVVSAIDASKRSRRRLISCCSWGVTPEISSPAALFLHGRRPPVNFGPIIYISGSGGRSEEHTSELQSLMRTSYAVFCWKKKQT